MEPDWGLFIVVGIVVLGIVIASTLKNLKKK
jgi:hypothetical protein